VDQAVPIPEDDATYVRTEGRDALAPSAGEFGRRSSNHRSQSPCSSAPTCGDSRHDGQHRHSPDLVRHACKRYLDTPAQDRRAALLGAEVIWVVDGLSDMISARDFETLSLPHLHIVMEEIRQAGLRSIFYFTGDPAGKLDLILSLGADALAFEDPKKGFEVDVVALARRVKGRATLFGNLDAVGVLQDGTEGQLREEVKRQLAAAPLNAGRFVMSIGSPVTPGTSVERCRLFCDLEMHELGRS
jgi:uroporphyrinogen-III decarboxylase